jgi:hypothetical protein
MEPMVIYSLTVVVYSTNILSSNKCSKGSAAEGGSESVMKTKWPSNVSHNDTKRMVQVDMAFDPTHKCLGHLEMFPLLQSVQQMVAKTTVPPTKKLWLAISVTTSNITNVNAVTFCSALSPQIRCGWFNTAWKQDETTVTA